MAAYCSYNGLYSKSTEMQKKSYPVNEQMLIDKFHSLIKEIEPNITDDSKIRYSEIFANIAINFANHQCEKFNELLLKEIRNLTNKELSDKCKATCESDWETEIPKEGDLNCVNIVTPVSNTVSTKEYLKMFYDETEKLETQKKIINPKDYLKKEHFDVVEDELFCVPDENSKKPPRTKSKPIPAPRSKGFKELFDGWGDFL